MMKSKRNGGLWLAIPVLMLMGTQATATNLEATWKHFQYSETENSSPSPAGVSLTGQDEPLLLANDIVPPTSASISPKDVDQSLSAIAADDRDEAPAGVSGPEAYFILASGSVQESVVAEEPVSQASVTSGVSITCDTLSSRLKYKSPACDGASGAFDLVGCQFNYDDTVAVRKRGITRVVFYRAGHRGDPAHALSSRTYLCNDTSDRAELQSWFSTPAFRQICRREDYDIPYQTVAASCQ